MNAYQYTSVISTVRVIRNHQNRINLNIVMKVVEYYFTWFKLISDFQIRYVGEIEATKESTISNYRVIIITFP